MPDARRAEGLCLLLAALTPDLLRSLDDGAELVLFDFDAYGVANYGGGEATLRNQGQPLQRNISSCLVESGFQLFSRFEPGCLGGDEAEYGYLILRHVREGIEVPRAFVIVLEHQPLCVYAAEDAARQRLVGARDQPAAPLVAPAKVEGEGDVRVIPDHEVVELDPPAQPAIEVPAEPLVERAGFGIQQ